ncbi:MAG: hypothetical protein AUK31_01985 [Fibrobacteres bacterium CG2_30_45_31]|nr:MAG: hypothetical protein AUK31_01985 [Fibrobacteres bacterium CG2_30_45_31]PIP42936.1 MAG: hypothetical protein COX17_09750 [Deltaproteobacteria bacterium CG23_combo_of_CG06-09_8_20_14_all_60_8]
MIRKIKDLIRDLEHAGFVNRGGKGSHRNFKHASGIKVTIGGSPGVDAMLYQERDVEKALQEAAK